MIFNFSFLKNKQFLQSLLLLGTTVVVMIFTLIINYYLTRILNKSAFGDYSLILNIFNFSVIIFNFGFFHSISRMIALSKNDIEQRKLYGTGLIIVFCLFILMVISLSIYSYTFNEKQNLLNVRNILLISLPFCWVFLLNNFNELLLQGNNRIGLLCISRLVPRFFFLLVLIIIYYQLYNNSSITTVFISFILCNMFTYIYIVIRLKPSFESFKFILKDIITANNSFGFNIYLGSLIAVGASSLTGIFISYFSVNNTEVGYYTIALQLTTPLSLIPNVLATVYFKKFANSNIIDKKLLWIMYLSSLFALIIVFLFARSLITIIYGVQYIEVVKILYLLTISSLLYGIADFYNKFLLSKGKGKELRNASFIVGTVLLISNVIFIKIYGVLGATIAAIISGFFYLLIIIYYFKKSAEKV